MLKVGVLSFQNFLCHESDHNRKGDITSFMRMCPWWHMWHNMTQRTKKLKIFWLLKAFIITAFVRAPFWYFTSFSFIRENRIDIP